MYRSCSILQPGDPVPLYHLGIICNVAKLLGLVPALKDYLTDTGTMYKANLPIPSTIEKREFRRWGTRDEVARHLLQKQSK